MTTLERLDHLLRQNAQRAKVDILKHLDGDLVIVPRPSSPGERRAEISGLRVVAGARNHVQATRMLAFRFDITA